MQRPGRHAAPAAAVSAARVLALSAALFLAALPVFAQAQPAPTGTAPPVGPTPTPTVPAPQPPVGRVPPRVVVVLVDRTTAAMLSGSSSVQGLAAQGAAGLMIADTGPGDGGEAPLAAAATLSAGEPAVAPVPARHDRAVQPGAPDEAIPFGQIEDLYETRAGRSSEAALLYPDVALMGRLNAAATVGASPGLLGETLRRNRVRVAAVGTSDLPRDALRPAAILAMNARGEIPLGSVATDLEQPDQVLPVAVDLQALQTATQEALGDGARLVVVDWGDTSRIDRLLDRQRDRLDERDPTGLTLERRLEQARTRTIRQLDEFLRFVNGILVPTRDIVAVISPTPPRFGEGRGLGVAPIVVGGGRIAHGSLTSGATEQHGVVSSADLAPSVLSWLRVPVPAEMRGRVMEVATEQFPLRAAQEDMDALEVVDRQRRPLAVAGFALWGLAVAIGLAVVEVRLRRLAAAQSGAARAAHRPPVKVVRGRRRRAAGGAASRPRTGPEERLTPVRGLLFATAFVPLVLLLRTVWGRESSVATVILLLVLAVVLGLVWAASGQQRTATGLGTIAVFTLIAVLADRITGGALADESALGPDLSNDDPLAGPSPVLVGVAVAAVIVGAAAVARALRRRTTARAVVLVAAALALALLSLPALGGSPLVAVAGGPGLVVGAALLWPRQPSRMGWGRLAAGVAAVLVVLGTIALVLAVSEARPARVMGIGGPAPPAAAAAIALRRASDGFGLFVASLWTPLLAASGAALAYLLVRFRRRFRPAGPRARTLPAADAYADAAVLGLAASAAAAALTSTDGAATAAVVLMAATLPALGTALDRVRAVRR